MTWGCSATFTKWSKIDLSFKPAGAGSNWALISPSALSATSQYLWSTAIKSPSLTTRTPGTFSAALVSTLLNFAPSAGGRKIRAHTMPGRVMSPAYLALPVTFSIASRRSAGDFPITLKSFGDFIDTLERWRSMCFPCTSSP